MSTTYIFFTKTSNIKDTLNRSTVLRLKDKYIGAKNQATYYGIPYITLPPLAMEPNFLLCKLAQIKKDGPITSYAVSYTHLTLPTIYSV